VAECAHKGQKDKAGIDYINHPLTVASFVESEDEKIAALLHDVLEDTEFPEIALRILFGDKIVDSLLLLRHEKGVNYFDYVAKIKSDPLARAVKLADLRHNSDLSRLPEITEKDLKRAEKYKKAIEILKEDYE
jgi:(p)ppGpp synthase/HD superfamily hydrolase